MESGTGTTMGGCGSPNSGIDDQGHGGAGDFKKYSELSPQYQAGLFLLKYLNTEGELKPIPQSERYNPDYEENKAEINQLLTTACVQTLNEEQILNAITQRKVDERMISLTSGNYPKLFNRVVETYTHQLLSQEQRVKAMNYFLLINRHEDALRTMLVQKEYYRQALVFAKLFMPTRVEELSKDVAKHYLKIGEYPIAVEILCSNGSYTEALDALHTCWTTLASEDALLTIDFVGEKVSDPTISLTILNSLSELVVDHDTLVQGRSLDHKGEAGHGLATQKDDASL